MRRALALLAVGMLAAACGTPSQGASSSEKPSVEAAAKAVAAQGRCDDALGELLDKSNELDSRLDIGMNYNEYGNFVADIKVIYDNTDMGDLSADCLVVAIGVETALNEYITALTKWGNCIDSYYCEDPEPRVQPRWSEASRLLGIAEGNLEDLAKPDS